MSKSSHGIPVIDGDKDHIIGLINLKEILTDILGDRRSKVKNT